MTLSPEQRRPVISDGLPSQLPDVDPAETREWIDALRGAVDQQGPYRARFLMLKMIEEARHLRVGMPALRSTDTSTPVPWSKNSARSRNGADLGDPAYRQSSGAWSRGHRHAYGVLRLLPLWPRFRHRFPGRVLP